MSMSLFNLTLWYPVNLNFMYIGKVSKHPEGVGGVQKMGRTTTSTKNGVSVDELGTFLASKLIDLQL